MSRKPLLDPELARPFRKGKGITIIIPGIHTGKDRARRWMPRFAAHLRHWTGSGVVLFLYGWTSGISIRMPIWGYFSRRSKLARLRRLVRRVQKDHPGEVINLIAHSFGTWPAFWAGILGKPKKRVEIERVVLMAPIIDVDQELPPYGPKRIACLFSREDDTIRKAPFGHAGAWGFANADGERLVNIDLTPYEHGRYTEPGDAWEKAAEFIRRP